MGHLICLLQPYNEKVRIVLSRNSTELVVFSSQRHYCASTNGPVKHFTVLHYLSDGKLAKLILFLTLKLIK